MSSLRTLSFHVIPKSRRWNLWCVASSFLLWDHLTDGWTTQKTDSHTVVKLLSRRWSSPIMLPLKWAMVMGW